MDNQNFKIFCNNNICGANTKKYYNKCVAKAPEIRI